MSSNYKFEQRKLYHYLGQDLVEALKEYKCFVAGGTITSLFCNREINDIDIYFKSEDQLIHFLEEVWDEQKWVVSHTKKATSIQYDSVEIQLIHFDYFKNAEDLFNTFDFTVCMGAYDFESEEFILHKDFFKHNSQRILKFNEKTSYPIVSALRVQKYEDKGYSISKPEYIRILLTCMNLNINSYDDLKEQMGGMYGVNYDKLFKDVKDKEFSLTTVIQKLADLNLHEDYFKKPNSIEFSCVEDLINNIAKNYTRRYFELNENCYQIKGHRNLSEVDDIKDFHVKIDPKEYFKDMKLYKFVNVKDGRYFSFYDEKFEYKIGEIATANNIARWGSGLYFNHLNELEDSTYYRQREEGALIEVEIETEDFKRLNGWSLVFNKCKVIREVPKDEYERYQKSKNDEELFYL